jgi:hypothetical protein
MKPATRASQFTNRVNRRFPATRDEPANEQSEPQVPSVTSLLRI